MTQTIRVPVQNPDGTAAMPTKSGCPWKGTPAIMLSNSLDDFRSRPYIRSNE